MYVYLLIAIMSFLLFSHFLTNLKQSNVIEGLESSSNNGEYQSYDEQNDPAILARKNAANISYIKERIDGIDKLNQMVNDLKKQVDTNTENVNKMIEATAEKAEAMKSAKIE